MPVYEYRCKACGRTHEIEHGFNDARPTKCSACGGQLVRVFHPVGVVFKGSGFHKTDYSTSGVRKDPADQSKPEPQKTDGKPAEGKSSESKPASEAKPKSSDPKPSDSKKSS